MAKQTTRTSYSDETKIRAVREYLDPNRQGTTEDLVAKYGLSSSTLLYSWKAAGWGDGYEPIGSTKPAQNGHAIASVPAPAPRAAESEELARLRAENAELRSLLKKLL